MNENTHIDKIFKDGLGEMNFSNTDAMWQKMETELDKGGREKRPFIFFILLGCLLTAGIFTVKHFNQPSITTATETQTISTVTDNNNKATENDQALVVKDKNATPILQTSSSVGDKPINITAKETDQTLISVHKNKFIIENPLANEVFDIAADKEASVAPGTEQQSQTKALAEKVLAQVDLKETAYSSQATRTVIPALQKITVSPGTPKKQVVKANTISIEAVGGGDILRLNRKAGFYAGIRLNKHLDKGSLISIGVNYASHTVLDRYRVANKPMDRGWFDAGINSMSSVRVPIYLQRQMAKSKFAMMIGLVPTYITAAEVYNVSDSYIGDPNPYRKFTLNDFNRFNLLFGAGLKYTPVNNGPFNRLSFELSGNYSFTGLVKDGYKNWSRVNDNFKSIQLGIAFRLK